MTTEDEGWQLVVVKHRPASDHVQKIRLTATKQDTFLRSEGFGIKAATVGRDRPLHGVAAGRGGGMQRGRRHDGLKRLGTLRHADTSRHGSLYN